MTPPVGRPRRVLIFSLMYYHRFVGGAEVAVEEITRRIDPQEIEFDMITMRTESLKFERVGNINVHRIGPHWKGGTKSFTLYALKYLYMPLALMKALRLHGERQYDLTWSIMANYASGPALFFKLMHKKVKLILTLQEGDPFSHIRKRVGINYPFFKKLFRVTDHIHAISTYLADWAKEMGATCPITVVPNGVDLSLFSTYGSLDADTSVRQRLGISPSDTLLITTGRLVVKNAVADTIKALSLLGPTVKFLSIGGGHLEHELRQLVSQLKLDARVTFLPFMPQSELPPYLRAATIFVRPSLSEGLGNSFLEAMATGLPVIATPVGGIPEFLVDGETGLFCEINNPQSIAQKVEKLLKDKESRDFIVKNARAMVEKDYNWKFISIRMGDLFTEVISR